MRILVRGLAGLAVLVVVLVAAAYAWLFLEHGAPRGPAWPLDMAAVRAAAAAQPGPRAASIQVETVAHRAAPRIAMVAGTDWSKFDASYSAFKLVFPDRTLLIDTTLSPAVSKAMQNDRYDPAARVRVEAAMRAASAIVFTHEHADHTSGLLSAPDRDALLAKAIVTPEQIDSPQVARLPWPADVKTRVRLLRYEAPTAIAPGVVLIKAPGHTPGSQMIYVQLADGTEDLFVGDTASLLDNVRLQRSRSRYIDDVVVKSDHAAVMRQLAALHALAAREPQLAMIPGHDGAALDALVRAGRLQRGFR